MKHEETAVVANYIADLWPNSTEAKALRSAEGQPEQALRLLFRSELGKHPPMPVKRALEVVNAVRLGSKYPDIEHLLRELGLEARRIAAGVANQNAGIAANRQPADASDNSAAHDAELRRWLDQRHDAELADLVDRCLRRQGSEARWIRMVRGVDSFTREDFDKHLAVCVPMRMEWRGEFGHLPLGDERAPPMNAPVDFRTGEGVGA